MARERIEYRTRLNNWGISTGMCLLLKNNYASPWVALAVWYCLGHMAWAHLKIMKLVFITTYLFAHKLSYALISTICFVVSCTLAISPADLEKGSEIQLAKSVDWEKAFARGYDKKWFKLLWVQKWNWWTHNLAAIFTAHVIGQGNKAALKYVASKPAQYLLLSNAITIWVREWGPLLPARNSLDNLRRVWDVAFEREQAVEPLCNRLIFRALYYLGSLTLRSQSKRADR